MDKRTNADKALHDIKELFMCGLQVAANDLGPMAGDDLGAIEETLEAPDGCRRSRRSCRRSVATDQASRSSTRSIFLT